MLIKYKKMDCIFCNPPYSEFEEWAEKIILEGNSKKIVLVIPERWRNSERIKFALEKRKYTFDSIGFFDFQNAERKARANVEVIGVRPDAEFINGSRYDRNVTDPFDTWFDN